ncbi:Glutaredoxin domain-containing protein [Psidium guajava]|nr:Glutaredoxin domain-containing protein [Psidium guajava]
MEDLVSRMTSEKPVVIFSKSSCCMSHIVKVLLYDSGLNPMVHELDEMPRDRELEQALMRRGCSPAVPAVFIGGQLVGGTNELMSLLLSRSLIPICSNAPEQCGFK